MTGVMMNVAIAQGFVHADPAAQLEAKQGAWSLYLTASGFVMAGQHSSGDKPVAVLIVCDGDREFAAGALDEVAALNPSLKPSGTLKLPDVVRINSIEPRLNSISYDTNVRFF